MMSSLRWQLIQQSLQCREWWHCVWQADTSVIMKTLRKQFARKVLLK